MGPRKGCTPPVITKNNYNCLDGLPLCMSAGFGGSVDDIPIGDGGFDRRAVDSRSVLCGVARVHL